MAGQWSRWTVLAAAALVAAASSSARAVDLQLFADHDKACAYLATAQPEGIATVEIWLTILLRDAASGEGTQALARDDLQRLDGEARTIEIAITVMDAQIAQGHVTLRKLRGRLRAIESLPDIEATPRRAERETLRLDMRAASEELIEISFGLRDAKARLASMRAAIAGQRDGAAMIDAAQATARRFARVIRDCARARRASLAAAMPDIPSRR